MFKPKSIGAQPSAPHVVMRDQHGGVIVKHPSLPGPHMLQPKPDYAEVPFGSLSKHNPPGGISGGLAPFQSDQSAQGGEYANG